MTINIKNSESSQINNLMVQNLRKTSTSETKISRWKEIIKIIVEMNETGTKRTIQRIRETKSWFFHLEDEEH
jgi:hypothetical protein